MTGENHKEAYWGAENDDLHRGLDRELDAALAKYSAVEPRVGLENRVLANLRDEQAKTPERALWRWGLAAALTAVIMLAVALAWRSGKPEQVVIKHHPATTIQNSRQSETQIAAHDEESVRAHLPIRARKIAKHRTHPTVIAVQPKLDTFPSPQPLSEQEKLLANYVAEDPDRAVLVARARAEALLRDQIEEMRKARADNDGDARQQNQ